MKIKNILFNTWPGAFFDMGGGEVQLLETYKALEQKGYNIHFYDQWKPQQDFQIFHQFSVILGVEHALEKYKVRGKKIVLSTILWPTFSKDNYYYEHVKYLLNMADIVLTNSHAESEKIAKMWNLPAEKFFKTRNAIGSDYLVDGDPRLFRDKFGIKSDFILSVGNIDKRKNTRMLVRAAEALGKPLIVIGAVRDESYFRSILGESSHAQFLGPIFEGEMIRSAMAACRMFALPSLLETPGLAALEAASQGAQIMITQEGATREYFGDSAIYVDPMSFESVVNGIEESFKKDSFSGSKQSFRSTYTWELAASDVIEGYRKIL